MSVSDTSIALLVEQLNNCEIFHSELEFQKYDYPRWGEKSIPYTEYSRELSSLKMHLNAAIESFELGMLRVFFQYGLRETVADEFYEKEI